MTNLFGIASAFFAIAYVLTNEPRAAVCSVIFALWSDQPRGTSIGFRDDSGKKRRGVVTGFKQGDPACLVVAFPDGTTTTVPASMFHGCSLCGGYTECGFI